MEATLTLMRFGWQTHRESFLAIVDDVHHEQVNHLRNLILLMDFMIPVVSFQLFFLFVRLILAHSRVGAGLFPCNPIRNLRRFTQVASIVIRTLRDLVQACISSCNWFSSAHHGVS